MRSFSNRDHPELSVISLSEGKGGTSNLWPAKNAGSAEMRTPVIPWSGCIFVSSLE